MPSLQERASLQRTGPFRRSLPDCPVHRLADHAWQTAFQPIPTAVTMFPARARRNRPAADSKRYAMLAAAAFAAASVIILAAAYLMPPGEPTAPPDGRAAEVRRWGRHVRRWQLQAGRCGADGRAGSAPQARVMLASTPAPATAEQLQEEATEVAEELRARFPDLPEALHVVAMLSAAVAADRRGGEAVAKSASRLSPETREATTSIWLPSPWIGATANWLPTTLQQALDAGCASADVRHHLAIALTNLGRGAEAEGVIQKALADAPQSPACWLVLGQAQLKLGKAVEAEASLRKAIDLGSRSPTVYFALGNACTRQGKEEEAAKFRERFTELKASQPLDPQQRYQVLSTAEARGTAVTTLLRGCDRPFLAGGFPGSGATPPTFHCDSTPPTPTVAGPSPPCIRAPRCMPRHASSGAGCSKSNPDNFINYLNLAKVCRGAWRARRGRSDSETGHRRTTRGGRCLRHAGPVLPAGGQGFAGTLVRSRGGPPGAVRRGLPIPGVHLPVVGGCRRRRGRLCQGSRIGVQQARSLKPVGLQRP